MKNKPSSTVQEFLDSMDEKERKEFFKEHARFQREEEILKLTLEAREEEIRSRLLREAFSKYTKLRNTPVSQEEVKTDFSKQISLLKAAIEEESVGLKVNTNNDSIEIRLAKAAKRAAPFHTATADNGKRLRDDNFHYRIFAEWAHKELSTNNSGVRKRLEEFGIMAQDLETFKLGYLPGGKKPLFRMLSNIAEDCRTEIENVSRLFERIGLVKVIEEGLGSDFSSRIIAPRLSASGEYCGVEGYTIYARDEREAKISCESKFKRIVSYGWFYHRTKALSGLL